MFRRNIKWFYTKPYVLNIINMIMYSIIIATSILLQRHKKEVKPMITYINQRTLRLSQMYIICIIVFKIPLCAPVVIYFTVNTNVRTKALLYLVVSNIQNLDPVGIYLLKVSNRNTRTRC